jgi:hypothetical protein
MKPSAPPWASQIPSDSFLSPKLAGAVYDLLGDLDHFFDVLFERVEVVASPLLGELAGVCLEQAGKISQCLHDIVIPRD